MEEEKRGGRGLVGKYHLLLTLYRERGAKGQKKRQGEGRGGNKGPLLLWFFFIVSHRQFWLLKTMK